MVFVHQRQQPASLNRQGEGYQGTRRSAIRRYFCAELVSARKTRSSTAMVRVKSVGTPAVETAMAPAEPEMAGPAGLPCKELVSPGTREMRVVLGVQGADAPKHVSRAKT